MGTFDWALLEEDQCARPPSNFCSSAAIVDRANCTDSAAGLKSAAFLQLLPALRWKKLEEGSALPALLGRGWERLEEPNGTCPRLGSFWCM